jgi:hypothetical protein
VCAGCRVRLSCLEGGIEEQWGVWGGLTALERKRLRRTQGRAA